jgi:hypothetical protein
MRRFYHHPHRFHRRWRRPLWRPRPGRLLGMVGIAALGYTLLNKNRREQSRQSNYVNVDPNQDW